MTDFFSKKEVEEARKRVARSEAAIGKDFDKMTEEEFNESIGPYLCRADGMPPLWPRAPRWPNDPKLKVLYYHIVFFMFSVILTPPPLTSLQRRKY